MSVYSDHVIVDGASAYWRLNETSGTTAVDVVGGKNGTISGGVTLNQAGATSDGDRAMTFNGTTGKINVATGAYQTFGTGPLTVECWLRLISITTGVAAFVDMKGNGSGAAGPALLADSTSFYFRMNTGATQVVANGPAAAITDGQWRHLVGVLSRGPDELRLYLNGALIGGPVTFSAGANVSSTQGTGIGTDSAGSVWFLNGAMDDVAVYPTALTAAQVANHYNVARSAEPISPALLGIGVRELLLPNYKYIVPIKTRLINWQSPTGSSLTTSMDGTNFEALGTSGANEVKQVTSFGSFIRTNSFDTIVVAK